LDQIALLRSVLTQPGAIALHRTFDVPHSIASVRVRLMTAAFAAP
jgi:hypothetical protein